MRGRAVVAAQCRTDTAVTFCCSGGGPRQPWSSGLAPVSRCHSSIPFSHSSQSLIGLLDSVDVKQQQLTLATHRHAPPLAASIILTLKYRSVSVRDGQTTRRQVLRRIRTDIVCFSLTVDAASEAIKGEVRVCVCGGNRERSVT